MKRIIYFIIGLAAVIALSSCGSNGPKPKGDNKYIQTENGLMLPSPNAKDASKYDYNKVLLTFEADGVCLKSVYELTSAMMTLQFIKPQLFKGIPGIEQHSTTVQFTANGAQDGWNIYYIAYPSFREFIPGWTWNDINLISIIYDADSFKIHSEHKKYIDPDFDANFRLFKEYTSK